MLIDKFFNCVTGIYRRMISNKKQGLSVSLMATRVMPSLLPQTMNPQLSLDQFSNLLEVLQEMLEHIDRFDLFIWLFFEEGNYLRHLALAFCFCQLPTAKLADLSIQATSSASFRDLITSPFLFCVVHRTEKTPPNRIFRLNAEAREGAFESGRKSDVLTLQSRRREFLFASSFVAERKETKIGTEKAASRAASN
jgi:hypothetical protein